MTTTTYECRNCGATGPHLDDIDVMEWCTYQDPTDVYGLPVGTCQDCGAPVYEPGTFDKMDAARAMLAALEELLQEAEQAGWGRAGYTDNAHAAIEAAKAAGITPAPLTK